jgi:hypothetical protein
MSPKAVRNIEAGAVFVGAVALLIWVPQQWFLEVAMAMLVGAIGGVVAIRKYFDRLDEQVKSLEAAGRPEDATALRIRRVMLTDLAVAFAIVGLTAFIALVVVYGD